MVISKLQYIILMIDNYDHAGREEIHCNVHFMIFCISYYLYQHWLSASSKVCDAVKTLLDKKKWLG